jgi:hypothetical protein
MPPEIHQAAASQALSRAVAEYEPEAAGALLRSPGSLLSVLLEAGRRASDATSPHAAAAERERIRELAEREYDDAGCYDCGDGALRKVIDQLAEP